MWTRVGPSNHVLGGGTDREMGNFLAGGGCPLHQKSVTTCYNCNRKMFLVSPALVWFKVDFVHTFTSNRFYQKQTDENCAERLLQTVITI